MKRVLPLVLFSLSLPAAASVPGRSLASVPADLYRCQLTQKIPGYLPETIVGLIAPSDTRLPSEGQLHVFPNIHLGRGNTGLDAVVYGFHGGSRPGSRLLLQLIDPEQKEDKVVMAYETDPVSVAIEYKRERDGAEFRLACDRAGS